MKGGVNMRTKLLRRNPVRLDRHMQALYELGLEEDEIQYLLHLRMKQYASTKWF
ncbi:hypothetical protein ACFLZZ_02740 [Nanoarchaeota archaeon]